MASAFEKVLLAYPSAPWDWALVSSNPAVSFEFMLSNPTLPWMPRYVSRNVNISENDIRSHLEYPWDYEGLCMNPNVSLAFFREYIIKPDVVHRVDWHLLSSNPSVTMFDVINNPNYKWDDRYLSSNPNLTSNFILNEGKQRDWHIPSVCANPGITQLDIYKSTLSSLLDRQSGKWDYKNLSANVNLPIAFVNKNIEQDWNFHSISINASLNDIATYHQIKWEAYGLSMNPNINLDYVKKNTSVKWHIPTLLTNSSIKCNAILDNLDWFRTQMTQPIEPYMCSNATITKSWIERNERNIDWHRLSMNTLS